MRQKIYWVQDLDFMTQSGGAEQTDRVYFMEGARRGYDMQIVTPSSGTVPVGKQDIAVLSNITAFPHGMISHLPCRTVTFTHDYGFCVWRLYMPMSRKCLTDCPGFEYWNQLFEKSELNFFLSPLHLEVHKLRFKDAIDPAFITPSGIDVSQFKPLRKKREGYCNLNGLLTFKGRENLLEWARNHPKEQLDIGGSAEEPGFGRFDKDLPPNVKYVGAIDPSKLNEWYNRYKYYLELPSTAQPYNRTCLPGKAKVYTDSGWKRIMDIRIGDLVITHTGRFKKVVDTMSRSAMDARVSIQPAVKRGNGMKDLLVTSEHPILTARGWVKADDLMESDNVATLATTCKGCGTPIYFNSEYCSSKCVSSARDYKLRAPILLPFSPNAFELGWVAAALDSEGCVSARVDTRGRGSFHTYITVTNNSLEFLEQFRKITGFGLIRRKYGKKADKTYVLWIEKKDEVFTVLTSISSCLIVKKKQAELVLRLMEALRLPSRSAFYSIAVDAYNEIRTLNTRGMAVYANIPRSAPILAQKLEQKLASSFAYVPIHLERYQPTKPHKVYNLDIEDDHSYVAQGIVVHNCSEAYLAGCELITNGLMGCTTFPWFTSRASVRSHLKSAPTHFWNTFEKEMKL